MLELDKIYCIDCIEGMKKINENSIDLVIVDPPYYKIKNDKWDRQWDKFEEYINWIKIIGLEIKRILKDNGSFYIFGDEKSIAYVQVALDNFFILINNLVWYKRNNISIKWAHLHRSYAPTSERILFYSNQDRTGLETMLEKYIKPIHPMATYLKKEFSRAGVSCIEVADACGFYGNINHGGMVSNWLSGDSFPSKQQYLKIKNYLNKRNDDYLKKRYDKIFQKYCRVRDKFESTRRYFQPIKRIYEVIDIPIIHGKENTEHPTTKPLELIKILIKTSSREGDIVLDPVIGSGTTALASRLLNRKFIGFEINPEYVEIANKRLKNIPERLEKWIES